MKTNRNFVLGLGASKAIVVCCAFMATRSGLAEEKPNDAHLVKASVSVNVQQAMPQPDVLGKWKVHIFEVERNPTVVIDDITDSKVTGTYIGTLGHFPLTGSYAPDSGDVHLQVDFSKSPIARFKKMKSLVGNMDGQIKGATINGLATFPDFENRQFHWEAKKDAPSKTVRNE